MTRRTTKLLSIELADFRNYSRAQLALSPRSTVLVGPNAQGKTNLIEAVYFAATLRPLRAGRLSELVRFGAAEARVGLRVEKDGVVRAIEVAVGPAGRSAMLDGKVAPRLDDYFAGPAVVAFTPDDLAVVKGGPELRRRALDRAVWNRWPVYIAEARDYHRALRSRNRALRLGLPAAEREAFEPALCRLGARLWARRHTLLAEMAPRTAEAFAALGGGAPLVLSLAPAGVDPELLQAGEPALADALARALARRLARDSERKFTSAGPHADDLAIALGTQAARTFASQGQQRAIVLALKIAEMENLAHAHGRAPLLLLDDISSELDPKRSALLLGKLRALRAQALLTTTDLDLVQDALDPTALVVDVLSGTLHPRSAGHA